ncbi:NAD(P)/FAD-dependent oxidoreductase [Arthrobacter sp. B10-11]|uniref:NAD(P)/FAD-dependent oxidoreductase n=1 Tax=Arthrobacter sp. B10-11 TaxID=3081160 RepID=UPI002952D3F4|nr:FAD-dependent oxidoreductase [Arthrobacter sp. B10-11]MDV8148380.1 FAD-dependent oxidoreductase [Arthrobacter sp. B10-11]
MRDNEQERELMAGATAPVVIVGAGHSGVAVAAGLRTRGWEGGILLLEAEKGTPYERPPLSKELLKPGADDESAVLRKEKFYQDRRIDRAAGLAVESIDRQGRTVLLADGSRHAYHRLVIATGSRARPLTVPGAGLSGVQALRTKDDALELKRHLAAGTRVAIIGAGYIGLEVAAAAAARGCEVTVLEFQDRVMSRVTSAPVSRHFEQLHERHGVRFVFGAAVTGIEGTQRAERVVTADGAAFHADVVLAGIGVIPNQELAAEAGIECRDGILVDADGLTSDATIYATGDATRFTSPIDGASQRLECIQNAQAQADRVAAHITGQQAAVPEIPWFWTVQHGVRLQTAGVRHPDDEVIVRGDPASGSFAVVYLRDGRLAAVDTVAGLTDFRPARKLIAQGARMDPTLAADPGIHLSEAVLSGVEHSSPAPTHAELAAARI